MNSKALERLEKSKQPTIIYQREEVFPLLVRVECNEQEITAYFDDGRHVSIPKAWYPRLREANDKQLQNFRITSDHYGIHWLELDEHLSVKAFFKGLDNNS